MSAWREKQEGLVALVQARLFLLQFDLPYRRSFFLGVGGLLLSVPGLYEITEGLTFWSVLTGISMSLSVVGFVQAYAISRQLLPADPKRIARIVKFNSCLEIDPHGEFVETSFSVLNPGPNELKLGFKLISIENRGKETAHFSESFSLNLLLKQTIKIAEIRKRHRFSATAGIPSIDHEIRMHQLQFLLASVRGPNRTTNGTKVQIATAFSDWENGIKVQEIRYFDGEMTNEAFRSELFLAWRSDQDVLDKSPWVRPRRYFPMLRYGLTEAALPDHPIAGVSAHVGATTICISRDGYLVCLRQTARNNIGAGTIVSPGSGSMDFADVTSKFVNGNFLNAVKITIAREILEETGGTACPSGCREPMELLARQTTITGMFRWVDRCGKLEFTAITVLDVDLAAIFADDYELIPESELPAWKLRSLMDAEHFATDLARRGYTVALSTAMALRMMSRIDLAKLPITVDHPLIRVRSLFDQS